MLKITLKTFQKNIATISLVLLAALSAVFLAYQFKALDTMIARQNAATVSAESSAKAIRATRCEMNEHMRTGQNATEEYEITSADRQRTYSVHVPAGYRANARYPIILNFDGIDGSGERMQRYSYLDTLPAITVYLDSITGVEGFTAWQGAPYSPKNSGDVEFVADVLEALPNNYCINSAEVFAVGMSNGGAFANIVGCELGDKIKAVASVSGAYYTTCQDGTRVPSLLIVHSAADQQVPFNGGRNGRLPNIYRWVADRAVERGCEEYSQQVSTPESTVTDWLNCEGGSKLRLVVLPEQPHGWLTLPETQTRLGDDEKDNTAEYIWEFFKKG